MSRVSARKHTLCRRSAHVGLLLLSLSVALCSSQTTPQERTYSASKAYVEKALHDLQAYSGARLPILEGFAGQAEHGLDQYERGYYQYSLQVVPVNASTTRVRVVARISAWYASETPSESGYQVLPSNGRLESDLLDRLGDRLKTSSAHAAETPLPSPPNHSSEYSSSLPQAPRSTSPPDSVFGSSRTVSPSLPSRNETAAASLAETASDRRIASLAQEARNLEEILRNQSHPSDLAMVKESHTPVFSRPVEGSPVLFYAQAEDEFQIVDTVGEWIHVQISGLSRGWLQRSRVDFSGSPSENPTASVAGIPPRDEAAKDAAKPPFREIREETSTFPGNWSALRGKTVEIIWVQPSDESSAEQDRLSFAKTAFRKTYSTLSRKGSDVAGVVIVFDSEDGGMAAATVATLQQWSAGHLSESEFWKQVWLDPADSFKRE